MHDKQLEEKCGIVGVFTPKHIPSLPLALLAAGGVQHRGQQGSGLAIKTKSSIITRKDNGLLQQVFHADVVKKLNRPSQWILIHCRYGTFGSYLKENLQPCIVKTPKLGSVAVIHNGEFVATNEINKKLKKRMAKGTSDTYLFAQLLARTEGRTWDEKIISALSQVKGSYSLVIGTKDAMYVARDVNGIRPLVVGQIDNGWLAASETHAFDKVGAKVLREVRKGEVIRIDKTGMKTIHQTQGHKTHFCDFEWAYFSKPNSLLPTDEQPDDYKHPDRWLSVTSFRERCGSILSKESPLTNATFVVGVPDSGISIATAYAHALRIPYRQMIIRDHFDPNGIQRLFMRDDQKEMIGKKVLGKLSLVPDRSIWKDAIVVIGDDSIVRGNVSLQITKAIFAFGVKEIHWIIGFPPVMHRCHLGVSIRTREELIAPHNGADPKKIAQEIGATSVHYISSKGFIQARLQRTTVKTTKNPRELFLANGGCGGCITGLYPVNRSGKTSKTVY